MALYEHVFLSRQDASTQQVEDLTTQLKGIIEGLGGKIVKLEQWGVKTLPSWLQRVLYRNAVKALGHFEARVRYDGIIYAQKYKRGVPMDKVKPVGKYPKGERTGTTISFLPDKSIFKTIDYKYDVLAQLSGEITLELDSVAPQPVWKAILGVKDANRLQQTLAAMLIRARVLSSEYSDAGLPYHVLPLPSAQGTTAIAYAFIDGYLTIASSPTALAEAIRLHKNGESLGKSRRFLDLLPAGHTGMNGAPPSSFRKSKQPPSYIKLPVRLAVTVS